MPSMKCILLISLCCLLYGCSNSFVYNNLDWISEWVIDDYIDLNNQQESLLEDRLDAIHLWHRQQELPKYRSQLEQLSQQLKTPPLSYQEVLQQVIQIESHGQRLRTHISAEIAKIVPQLSAPQISALFISLEKKNQERLMEYQQQGEAEFKHQRIDRIEKQLDKYLGSTTPEQQLLVKVYVYNAYPMREEYSHFLSQYLSTLQQAFQQDQDQQVNKQIYSLLINLPTYKNSLYHQHANENRALAVDTLYSINSTLTKSQIKYLRNEINTLIIFIDKLIKH